MSFDVKRLGAADLGLMKDLLRLFGEVFAEPDTYLARMPSDAYLRQRLGDDTFLAVVALVQTARWSAALPLMN